MTNMHNKHCHLVCGITGKDDLWVVVIGVSVFEILHVDCENNCKSGYDTKNKHHPQNVFQFCFNCQCDTHNDICACSLLSLKQHLHTNQ